MGASEQADLLQLWVPQVPDKQHSWIFLVADCLQTISLFMVNFLLTELISLI